MAIFERGYLTMQRSYPFKV